MIPRRTHSVIDRALSHQPAVVLLGPRQAGKTTLALEVAESRASVYLDMESPTDRARLADPESYLTHHERELVIIDEVHRAPDLFPVLRGLIDAGRRRGLESGRFLLLGSAALDMLRQSGETLAGRVAYVELDPLDITEVDGSREVDRLWVRGGFPQSYLSLDDRRSYEWRQHFLRSYLERDIPEFGPRVPAEALRRLWIMLAHQQGATVNAALIARNLGIDGKTVGRYIDLLIDLLLIRRLPAWSLSAGKRLVRQPRIYIRDSGLVHALLEIRDRDMLLGHPVLGSSWEGYVIENILRLARDHSQADYYRTQDGAEIDLVMTWTDGERWAIEVKRSSAPRLDRGFHAARSTLEPDQTYIVYNGAESYPMGDGVWAIGLADICSRIIERTRSM